MIQGYVWRSDRGDQPQTLGPASVITWSKKGFLILSKTRRLGCSVSYWAKDDGGKWQEEKPPVALNFKQSRCCDISWSLDETWWAVTANVGDERSKAVVHIYQVLNGKLQQPQALSVNRSGRLTARMAPDGTHVFIQGWKAPKYLGELWSREGSQWSRVLWQRSGSGHAWSLDSKSLAFPYGKDIHMLQRTAGGWKNFTFPSEGDYFFDPAWSLNNRFAAVYSGLGVFEYDPNSGQYVKIAGLNIKSLIDLRCVAWSPNSQRLAVGGKGGKVVVLSLVGSDFRGLHLHTRKIMKSATRTAVDGVSWSLDGEYLAATVDKITAT